jgi:hypothetical protein
MLSFARIASYPGESIGKEPRTVDVLTQIVISLLPDDEREHLRPSLDVRPVLLQHPRVMRGAVQGDVKDADSSERFRRGIL